MAQVTHWHDHLQRLRSLPKGSQRFSSHNIQATIHHTARRATRTKKKYIAQCAIGCFST